MVLVSAFPPPPPPLIWGNAEMIKDQRIRHEAEAGKSFISVIPDGVFMIICHVNFGGKRLTFSWGML